MDCSPLLSREDLLQAEILLYEREEVGDWVHCHVFPPNTTTSQDLEGFTSSIPVKNLSDGYPRHAEYFHKVPLSQYLDKLINQKLVSLTEKAPNAISNVFLASEKSEDSPSNGIAADSKNPPLQDTQDETLPQNMQTEGPTNKREVKIIENVNDDITAVAPPGKGSLTDNDDVKESKREFSYVNQDNIKLGESSG